MTRPKPCKGCIFTGVNTYHYKHSVSLKVHDGNWLFAIWTAKTLSSSFFLLGQMLIALYHSLADTSTVSASMSCATCAWAFTNTNSMKFGANAHPLFFRSKIVHKGFQNRLVGLCPALYGIMHVYAHWKPPPTPSATIPGTTQDSAAYESRH